DGGPVVVYPACRLAFEQRALDAVAVEHHADATPFCHFRKAAFARADRQRPGGVIPAQRDAREFAARIAQVLTLVLVERERAVGSRKDVYGERTLRILAGPLHVAAERHDGAGADEQRHAVPRGRRDVSTHGPNETVHGGIAARG